MCLEQEAAAASLLLLPTFLWGTTVQRGAHTSHPSGLDHHFVDVYHPRPVWEDLSQEQESGDHYEISQSVLVRPLLKLLLMVRRGDVAVCLTVTTSAVQPCGGSNHRAGWDS